MKKIVVVMIELDTDETIEYIQEIVLPPVGTMIDVIQKDLKFISAEVILKDAQVEQ